VSNLNGKAYAMNAITPMKAFKTPYLKALFSILGILKDLQAPLKALSFIHFARWVIVKRGQFPWLGGTQPRETLHYDYMIFFSNFNGTWNQYIDAFSSVLSDGLDFIWDPTEKFPGSVPVTAFKRHIALCQFDTDYYFNAYPDATTNDVKAAHRVQAAFDAFAEATQKSTPEEFEKAYVEFLVQVQGDLGSLGPAPEGA
jgi:hypothetical protein